MKKNLLSEIYKNVQSRDAKAIAQRLPPEKSVEKVLSVDAEKLVDTLFSNLKKVFPAAEQTTLKTLEEENAAKQQWVAAFVENGIHSKEQLRVGMHHARASNSPFWPSPGQFITWCQSPDLATAGLPDIDTLMAEYKRYMARRGYYDSAEAFPWSAPVMYWIVCDMRSAMLNRNLTDAEVRRFGERQLSVWAKKIQAGQPIPAPVVRITNLTRPPTTVEEKGLVSPKTEELGRTALNAIRERISRKTKEKTED